MSLSVIPLTILGQITGVTGSGETALYQVSFKTIDGTPLYGVAAVWTDEQAEIEALAAQKPYGVWINPIDGEFTIKFAGYTYKGSADLTDPDVLDGITLIEFNNEAAGGGSGDFKLFEFEGTIDTDSTSLLYFSIPSTSLFEGKYLTSSVSEHTQGTYNMSGGMLGEGDFAYWYPQFSDENGNFQDFTLADTSVDAEMVTIDEMPSIKFKNNARIHIVVDTK